MSKFDKESDDSHKEDSFIHEKIKVEPVNKSQVVRKLGTIIVSGIIFGIISCVVFVFLYPRLSEYLESGSGQNTATVETQEDDTSNLASAQKIELNSYEILEASIYDIGKEKEDALVTVTSQTSEEDILNTDTLTNNSTTGMILKKIPDIEILTDLETVSDSLGISVTFSNGDVETASVIAEDEVTGIAILQVNAEDVSSETEESINTLRLSSSTVFRQGICVIAVGGFSISEFSIADGNITSTDKEILSMDRADTLLSTNIASGKNGTGILLDYEGNVIGIMIKGVTGVSDSSVVNAIASSDIKTRVKSLLNSDNIPYIGISGSTVNVEEQELYDLSEGIYVSEVAIDSPAMNAGIQNGDVIVSFDGKDITTMSEYMKKLESSSVGDEVVISVIRETRSGYAEIKCKTVIGVLQ